MVCVKKLVSVYSTGVSTPRRFIKSGRGRRVPVLIAVLCATALCLTLILHGTVEFFHVSIATSFKQLSQTPSSLLTSILSSSTFNLQLLPTANTSLINSLKPLISPFPVGAVRCVLYDRPPRTGSTTIYKALDTCLSRHGYASSLKNYRGIGDHRLISHMVKKQDSNKRSLLSRHLFFNNASIALLHQNCHALLYITSARPMNQRLLSKLKYETPDAKGAFVAERPSVPFDSFQQTLQARLGALDSTENYYETYPATYGAVMDLPDYVIRSTHFVDDLTSLLNVLRCNAKFRSSNVHSVQETNHTQEDEYLRAMPVKMGDARYNYLLELAKNNKEGLRKALLF